MCVSSSSSSAWTGLDALNCLPADIREIEYGQADIVLMVGDLEIFFQADDFGISDVCTVEE